MPPLWSEVTKFGVHRIMRVKLISTACIAMALTTATLTSQANNGDANHQWTPKQPSNNYWQAPNWSNFSMPPNNQSAQPVYRPPMQPNYQSTQPAYRAPMPPMYNNRYQPPVYGTQPPANYYPPQNTYRPNVNRAAPPAQNSNRGNPPPPAGPYRGAPYYGPGNAPSAFNMPGYNRNYRNNNSWNNNKFWGRSGPSTWMNPNKGNMERGWDDMINAPSRMGEMPGGWTAPEVTMPNPIDMGDQMQDNLEDLPEQMKNMDVGNN